MGAHRPRCKSDADARQRVLMVYCDQAMAKRLLQGASQMPLREERLLAACLLSAAGGFTDVYAYLFRGGVFANAVTGNLVIIGLRLAAGDAWGAAHGVCAVVAYGAGVMFANAVHARCAHARRFGWHQVVLWIEAALLLAVVWMPAGPFDFAVAALISFVCAMQVQAFRRVRGLPFASTMCTGNLRSGADAAYLWLRRTDPNELAKARHYALVIVCFVAGVVAGALLLQRAGAAAFGIVPLTLAAVSLLVHRRPAAWLRWLRRVRRGRVGR